MNISVYLHHQIRRPSPTVFPKHDGGIGDPLTLSFTPDRQHTISEALEKLGIVNDNILFILRNGHFIRQAEIDYIKDGDRIDIFPSYPDIPLNGVPFNAV